MLCLRFESDLFLRQNRVRLRIGGGLTIRVSVAGFGWVSPWGWIIRVVCVVCVCVSCRLCRLCVCVSCRLCVCLCVCFVSFVCVFVCVFTLSFSGLEVRDSL